MKQQIDVAENLRYYLNLRGVSQTQLAEHCGVSDPSVSAWCSGKTVPKMKNLEQIAELLNIDVKDLVEGKADAKMASAHNSLNYHFLVENQYLTEGQDLTSADVDFLNSVDRLLTLWFK